MAAVASFFGRFFGRTISESAAYGIGGALTEPIKPLLQELANETWATATAAGVGKPLGPGEAAEIVAEDVELRDWGVSQAGQDGYTAEQFDAVLGAVLNGPGLGYLFELWRRGEISDALFTHGLRKAKLEERWDGPLQALKDVLLSPGELANARQQGFIDDARQLAEAAEQGVASDRATIQFQLAGLPPGIDVGQRAANRDLIDRAVFDAIVREGHTKTKYTDLLWEMRKPVLSAAEYAGLHLRGWITQAEMNAGGALTGYTPAQMQLLFENRGRPASPHQMFVGLRRGATIGGATTGIPADFLTAIRQSNIRPEYSELIWRSATTYPSAFVLRGLTQNGDLTAAETEQILSYSGWDQALAAKVSARWAGGAGSTGAEQTKAELLSEYAGGYMTEAELRDVLGTLGYTGPALDREVHLADARRNASLRERVVKVIGDAYRQHAIDETAATSELAEVNVLGDAAASLIGLWEKERRFMRRELTDRQVATAFKKGRLTRDQALAELEERGYSAEDAATELAI